MNKLFAVINHADLSAALKAKNIQLVRLLLSYPPTAPALQNYSTSNKHNLVSSVVANNHAELIQLIDERFPGVLFQTTNRDCLPLYLLGTSVIGDKSNQILKYALGRPGIEVSLEIKNLPNLLFYTSQPNFSPIIRVILKNLA